MKVRLSGEGTIPPPQVLYEAEQVLPDGRSRYRNVPLSEKLIGEETWPDAVQRAVREELSGALPEGYKVCTEQGGCGC